MTLITKPAILENEFGIYKGEAVFKDRSNLAVQYKMNIIKEFRMIEIDGEDYPFVKSFPGNNWTHIVVLRMNQTEEFSRQPTSKRVMTFLCNTRGEVFYSMEGENKLRQFYQFSALAKSIHEEEGDVIITNRQNEQVRVFYNPRKKDITFRRIGN